MGGVVDKHGGSGARTIDDCLRTIRLRFMNDICLIDQVSKEKEYK
jgi:hypothetical protein